VLKRLKLHVSFNGGWHESFPTHKHGCGKRGRNLKILAKKAVFLVSSEKKNFTIHGLPGKTFGKIQ